jgi:hypothetical protein
MTNMLTPSQFVKKWSKIQLKEKAASQSHFNDICALVGHQDRQRCRRPDHLPRAESD